MSLVEATIADFEIEEFLIKMDEVNFQMSVLESEKKILTEKIKEFMGDKEFLLDNSGKISATWKNGKPMKRFDLESFKKDKPEEYYRYLKECEQPRRFLIKR